MTATGERRVVLVVDDDLSFVAFVCAAIEKIGLQPDVSLTGGDAMRRLRKTRYSCVLLDLKLPDIDGLEVLLDLRQYNNDVPVTVLTGTGTIRAATEAMRLGAADFLEKPVSAADIWHAVQMLMTLGKSADEWATGLNRLIDELAKGMNAVVRSPIDVPTVRGWCLLIGKSESSLYAYCEMAGVSAKAALDLARLLRSARCPDAESPRHVITAADPRTVARFFERAGVSEHLLHARRWGDVLKHQRLVTSHRLIDRVAFHMARQT